MTQTIKLDIMSDPICPWCYIGKAHLDQEALRTESLQGVDQNVRSAGKTCN